MTSTDKYAFFEAIRDGDLRSIRSMLNHDPSLVQERNENGLTPLMIAVASPDRTPQVVAALIEAGAAVNAQTDEGFTALHMMVDVNGTTGTGRIPAQLARLLVDAGVDIEARQQWGVTPLMRAVVSGTHDELQALIDVGGNVNKCFPSDTYPRYLGGRTTLMAAVSDPVKVQLLVRAGANVAATDAHERTALEYAWECLAEAAEDSTQQIEHDIHDALKTQTLAGLQEAGVDLDAPIDASGITARQMVETETSSNEPSENDDEFDYTARVRETIRILEELSCTEKDENGSSEDQE